jgi:hypothetical protein
MVSGQIVVEVGNSTSTGICELLHQPIFKADTQNMSVRST